LKSRTSPPRRPAPSQQDLTTLFGRVDAISRRTTASPSA
jgi:hypothetical protein